MVSLQGLEVLGFGFRVSSQLSKLDTSGFRFEGLGLARVHLSYDLNSLQGLIPKP